MDFVRRRCINRLGGRHKNVFEASGLDAHPKVVGGCKVTPPRGAGGGWGAGCHATPPGGARGRGRASKPQILKTIRYSTRRFAHHASLADHAEHRSYYPTQEAAVNKDIGKRHPWYECLASTLLLTESYQTEKHKSPPTTNLRHA